MWKDWLSLSKREQKGFVVLSTILISIIAFYLLVPLLFTPSQHKGEETDRALINWIDSVNTINSEPAISMPDSFFFFDPNEVSISKLQKLGVKGYALINWLKFREYGNRFTTPDDVLKIYSIDSTLAYSLMPYIRFNQIAEKSKTQQLQFTKQHTSVSVSKVDNHSSKRYVSEINKNEDLFVIEINSADTAEFTVLNGIGPVLSSRIVLYRKALGGFCDVEQLKEVYGMPPNTIDKNRKYLTVDSLSIRRININKVSLRRLKNHPYIGFYLAKAIIEYRRKNDFIKSVDEIISFKEVKPEHENKLAVYLYVE